MKWRDWKNINLQVRTTRKPKKILHDVKTCPSIIHPNFQTYSIKIYSFQHQSIQILVPHQVKSHLREGNARKKIERKEKKRTQRQRESSRGGSHSMEWKFIHANLFHEDQCVSPVSFLSFFPSFLSSKGEERNWNFFRLRWHPHVHMPHVHVCHVACACNE